MSKVKCCGKNMSYGVTIPHVSSHPCDETAEYDDKTCHGNLKTICDTTGFDVIWDIMDGLESKWLCPVHANSVRACIESLQNHLQIPWMNLNFTPLFPRSTETDVAYAERLIEALPVGHTYAAEDIGVARSSELDAIGARYGVYRK